MFWETCITPFFLSLKSNFKLIVLPAPFFRWSSSLANYNSVRINVKWRPTLGSNLSTSFLCVSDVLNNLRKGIYVKDFWHIPVIWHCFSLYVMMYVYFSVICFQLYFAVFLLSAFLWGWGRRIRLNQAWF